jgi:hypothetical protein
LAKSAAMQLNAHAIVPLDADEFIIDERGCNPRSLLLAVSPDAVISVAWRSYVPTPLDEPSEVDVLKRINNRLAIEAGVTKVIIGGSLPREPSFRLAHGSHSVFSKTSNIAPTLNPTFYLCHFPVRSAGQITAKVLLGQLSGSLATERPSWAQEHYRWLRETCAVHSYMSPAELQTVAERYALSKVADPPGLVFDPVKDASGLLRYTFQTSVDPAFRIEQFARRILLAKNGDAPTALRSLISDENVLLRAERDEALALLQLAEAGSLRAERDEALAQLQLAEAECRRMRASRAVRFSTAVRRIFNRRH